MSLPTPGKRKVRGNLHSVRAINSPQNSYRDAVRVLIQGSRPKGSMFFISGKALRSTTVTDSSYKSNHCDTLREKMLSNMGWFDVAEPDAYIHCACRRAIPVSIKMYALMHRAVQLGHLTAGRIYNGAVCSNCQHTVVVPPNTITRLITVLDVDGFMGDQQLRKALLRPLTYDGKTYGPEWFKRVDTPTMNLLSDHRNYLDLLGKTTVGELMEFTTGATEFADLSTVEYMYSLQVSSGGYYVMSSAVWHTISGIRLLLGSFLSTLRKNRVVEIWGTKRRNSIRTLRFYIGEKYIPFTYSYGGVDFTWRETLG